MTVTSIVINAFIDIKLYILGGKDEARDEIILFPVCRSVCHDL
jgi:hypothetical protein